MSHNIFESILSNIDNSIHQTNLKNTFIDEFIHDLQTVLNKKHSNLNNQNLLKDSIFYIDYIEDGFASCINTSERYSEKYEIPASLLDGSVQSGTYIQFDGEKYINVNKPEGYSLYD